MVKDEPVSLTRQTIYCIIPILDMYAAYRVKALRKYLLIMILVAVPVSIADSVLFPDKVNTFVGFLQFLTFYYGIDTNHFVASIIMWMGTVLLAIYLIRRWSKQWNKKFKSSTES